MYQSMKKRPFGRGNNILATVFLGTKIDHHIVSNYSPPSERGVSFLANGLNYIPYIISRLVMKPRYGSPVVANRYKWVFLTKAMGFPQIHRDFQKVFH